ncbi:MAG TPA: phosphate acyltransferase PlsX [Candidatus Limiplasma sp.]|nr:phosphate acyltransferase PlsX [Candidatus Limiplasma sp.]HRX09437.1 phosphate acyltransferase PlsX [Candidatus Limiplasma sp.]
MKIYLDAMGGDNAPNATVEGALEALETFPELTIELGGPKEVVEPLVGEVFRHVPELKARVTVADCPDLITNEESPVMAVRQKKQSAIVDGMLKLKDRQVDAFVSAGSTGAVLAGGMFRLGRIRGIDRPALAPLLPNGRDYFLLIDCGANVDCRPEYLEQFAMMGDAYMRGMRGVQSPRIGLVNNGAEAEKGCELTKTTYKLLEKSGLNFIGNVEGRDITHDTADVVVCDGFVGNVILKFMEGVATTLLGMIKKEITADLKSKAGALLSKGAFKRVKKTMDYSEVGGAPLLGVNGCVIKAHGSCNAHAIACAIKQGVQMIQADVTGAIETGIQSTIHQES